MTKSSRSCWICSATVYRQNRELMFIDKVMRSFIDKLQAWMRDKKFQIMLDLLHENLQKKLRTCVYRQSTAIVRRQVASVDAGQKVSDHVGFVALKSTDKTANLRL